MKILGVETNADKTAAAVVEDGVRILSNTVASQSKPHEKYGGVVLEIDSRMQAEHMTLVLSEASGLTQVVNNFLPETDRLLP